MDHRSSTFENRLCEGIFNRCTVFNHCLQTGLWYEVFASCLLLFLIFIVLLYAIKNKNKIKFIIWIFNRYTIRRHQTAALLQRNFNIYSHRNSIMCIAKCRIELFGIYNRHSLHYEKFFSICFRFKMHILSIIVFGSR